MATPTKIYLVTVTPSATTQPAETHLVRALTKAGAINRIAEQTITAKVPTQDELLACTALGMPILNASAAATV